MIFLPLLPIRNSMRSNQQVIPIILISMDNGVDYSSYIGIKIHNNVRIILANFINFFIATARDQACNNDGFKL